MQLLTDSIGSYKILAPLGAGGMGNVYRAHDTRLDREVAIKVLRPATAQNPASLARFEREAKILASLNHPHIAQIYGIEEEGGTLAIVMELVPGYVPKGPLSLQQTLHIAGQLASAIGSAHSQGIIHRDLKPSNLMLRPDGILKVLVFGISTFTRTRNTGSLGPDLSPTLTIAQENIGIVGTIATRVPSRSPVSPSTSARISGPLE